VLIDLEVAVLLNKIYKYLTGHVTSIKRINNKLNICLFPKETILQKHSRPAYRTVEIGPPLDFISIISNFSNRILTPSYVHLPKS
jgi:hypothetical protein